MIKSTSVKILDVPVTAQSYCSAIETILKWVQTRTKVYVSLATVYTIMQAQEHKNVMEALQSADMVTCDGMPLVWLSHHRGYSYTERVYGPDMMLTLCDRGQSEGIRHYLWGTNNQTLEALSANLKNKFPNISIVGMGAPHSLDVKNISASYETIKQLNDSKAGIIWVGLGSPKQDVWMHTYRQYLNAPVLIGVGAAFDIHADFKAQAPIWMQRTGLEWLFRLIQEPRRLAKRYLFYNLKFIWQIFRRK